MLHLYVLQKVNPYLYCEFVLDITVVWHQIFVVRSTMSGQYIFEMVLHAEYSIALTN